MLKLAIRFFAVFLLSNSLWAAETFTGSNTVKGGSTFTIESGVNLKGTWDFTNATVVGVAGGGGLSDGDKGDVTVAGSGASISIDNGAVSLAKLSDVTTATILGRTTAGTGVPQVLSALPFAFTGDVTRSANSNAQTIAANAVTYGKMQAVSGTSKILGSSSTTTPVQELTLGTGLSMTGTTINASAPVTDGDKVDITVSDTGASWLIDNGVVSLPKMANMATASLLGRSTAGSGAPEVLSALPFAFTGDVTRSSGSNAQTIANNAVTYGKMQAVGGTSRLLGSSSTTTPVQELTLGDGLAISGSVISNTQNPLTNGDKGDITVASSGAAFTIDNNAVTYGKIQAVGATSKLLGSSSTTTPVQEIDVGTGLAMNVASLDLNANLSDLNDGTPWIEAISASTDRLDTLTFIDVGGTVAQDQLPPEISFVDPGEGGQVFFDWNASRVLALKTLTPATLSGNVNNWNPTGLSFVDEDNPGAFTVEVNGGTSDRNITGIAGPYTGRQLRIINIGSTNKLVLKNQDSNSTDINRLLLPADTELAPGASVVISYSGGITNRWRMLSDALPNTAVTPGSCINCSLTISADGRITAATTGSAGSVTTTGSPATGNLAKFTGVSSISNGNLTGDVTTTDTLAATIANSAVTYAKMQDVSAASKILGRGDSGSGAVQELTLGTGLSVTGTTLNAAGAVAISGTPTNGQLALWTGAATIQGLTALPAANFPALTGDVTTSAGAVATTIASSAVTNAKMANMANGTFKGRSTAGTGAPEDIASTGTGSVVRGTGSSLTDAGFYESANGGNVIYGKRFTNTGPTGHLLLLNNATDTVDLFSVDKTGTMDAGIVPSARIQGPIADLQVNPRWHSIASVASPWTPDFDTYDREILSALASSITINPPTWTGATTGAGRVIRIETSGVRTLTWDAWYHPVGTTLPTTTVSGKVMYIGIFYNLSHTRGDVVTVSIEQ